MEDGIPIGTLAVELHVTHATTARMHHDVRRYMTIGGKYYDDVRSVHTQQWQ